MLFFSLCFVSVFCYFDYRGFIHLVISIGAGPLVDLVQGFPRYSCIFMFLYELKNHTVFLYELRIMFRSRKKMMLLLGYFYTLIC